MRRLTKLALTLAIGWLALWALASTLAPKLTDSVLAVAIPKIEKAGLNVDSLSWGEIKVAPTLIQISAVDVSAAFDLAPRDDIQLRSTFEARQVSVRLSSPLKMRGLLTIEEFEVIFHETDRPRRFPFDRLTHGELSIDDLPLLAPRQALREIRNGLETMIFDNALVGNFELRGVVLVKVHDQTFPARLYTERDGKQFRLRFDEADLQTVVEKAGVALSTEQVAIVSLYPVRVPFLIEITRQARTLSKNSYPRNNWLRDALRHVAWSYLLTTEFGPEFAKEVTDAQETKPGNTANERSMDYHNNAVGRQLAANGTRLKDLPRLVQSHPDIIRHPDEVDSRKELLR